MRLLCLDCGHQDTLRAFCEVCSSTRLEPIVPDLDANGERAQALCRDAAEARRAALAVEDGEPLERHGWLTLVEDQFGPLVSIGRTRE